MKEEEEEGCLGVEPRSVGIAFADGLCDLGKITLAEGLHVWGRRAESLLNYTLAFALQLRKSTQNLSQGSRVVGDYSSKPKLIQIIFKNSVCTAKKTQFFTITKIIWITLFEEIISLL
jgi:hypothetical protein